MTAPSLLALDVTTQARTVGVDRPVALSAGILAQFKDADRATLDAYFSALIKLVLLGGHPRAPLGTGASLVDVNGRKYVVLERVRVGDEAESVAIVSPAEVQLAGTLELALDVKERAERPPEWMQ